MSVLLKNNSYSLTVKWVFLGIAYDRLNSLLGHETSFNLEFMGRSPLSSANSKTSAKRVKLKPSHFQKKIKKIAIYDTLHKYARI